MNLFRKLAGQKSQGRGIGAEGFLPRKEQMEGGCWRAIPPADV